MQNPHSVMFRKSCQNEAVTIEPRKCPFAIFPLWDKLWKKFPLETPKNTYFVWMIVCSVTYFCVFVWIAPYRAFLESTGLKSWNTGILVFAIYNPKSEPSSWNFPGKVMPPKTEFWFEATKFNIYAITVWVEWTYGQVLRSSSSTTFIEVNRTVQLFCTYSTKSNNLHNMLIYALGSCLRSLVYPSLGYSSLTSPLRTFSLLHTQRNECAAPGSSSFWGAAQASGWCARFTEVHRKLRALQNRFTDTERGREAAGI